jgi:hypothetical protein
MSVEEMNSIGLEKEELYYSKDNKVVVKLLIKNDGFNTKIISSKLIGEGEFEVVLTEEEVDIILEKDNKKK